VWVAFKNIEFSFEKWSYGKALTFVGYRGQRMIRRRPIQPESANRLLV
jgi:hypothetical protein